MFSRASRRAFSQASRSSDIATVLAIRFHCNGELSTQNRAISVWSAVRALGVPTPSPPSLLTSWKSLVYLRLVSRYGGGARYCELSRSANGVTSPHPGTTANPVPGVNRHSPGSVPCG